MLGGSLPAHMTGHPFKRPAGAGAQVGGGARRAVRRWHAGPAGLTEGLEGLRHFRARVWDINLLTLQTLRHGCELGKGTEG